MIKELKLNDCLELLGTNYIGHLGFISGKSPYILPITYFHHAEEKCILSYSRMGHKIGAMRRYKHVTFQVDEIHSLQNWRSVSVHGNFEELEGSTAKKYLHLFAEGVQTIIIDRFKGKKPQFINDFSSGFKPEIPPIVYRIHISDIRGKFRKN